MDNIYNFSAGPACLSSEALSGAMQAIQNFHENGISLLEMSHRSSPVVNLFSETTNNLKALLNIPDNYHILWLQGGASTQFSMVPMNLLPEHGFADYVDTGAWSAKAITECLRVGKVNVVGSSKESGYSYIPKELASNNDASYLHITSNNTIFGTQYKKYPKLDNDKTFLVADMSSDILSSPLDVSKFGLIYAGAQKNMGPAGVTLVIIRSDLAELNYRNSPIMMRYNTHVLKESMYNTPPVFSVCVVNETLKWLKSLGGLRTIENINNKKANMLYDEIDRNTLFKSPVNKEDRSNMNVPFVFCGNDINDIDFLKFCDDRCLRTLKGHRSIGGFRASIYNAMPESGVSALIAAMQEFENLFT
jgi:phosphoserine aminotransferase